MYLYLLFCFSLIVEFGLLTPFFFILQTTMVSRLCVLVVLAACAGWAAGQETDYCSFTPEHTLCKFSGRGPRCGSLVRGSGVNREDMATIVALHNQLRSQVARGEETRGAPGPQPPGANIKTMVSVLFSADADLLHIQVLSISCLSITPPMNIKGNCTI